VDSFEQPKWYGGCTRTGTWTFRWLSRR